MTGSAVGDSNSVQPLAGALQRHKGLDCIGLVWTSP